MTVTQQTPRRWADYRALYAERPGLFANPEGAPVEILLDAESQRQVSACRWDWEIPRGGAEAGADSEATARREAEEELGCSVADLTDLGSVHPDTGIAENSVGLFLARLDDTLLLRPSRSTTTEGVDQVIAVTTAEFGATMRRAEMTDAFSLAAFAQAAARGLL